MRIIYRVDSKELKCLRLHLEERGALRKRMLYLSTLKELASDADRAALSLLTRAKIRASPGQSLDTLNFQQIDLDPALVEEALRFLVKTNCLYFDKMQVIGLIEGKVHWKAEALSDQACRVEPFLEGTIPLRDFRWRIFQCFLMEDKLLIATSSSDLKWIQRGPFLLEGAQRRKFFDDEPLVQWKKREEVSLAVLPQLHLHDATGCFADLYMNYTEHDSKSVCSQVGCLACGDLSPTIGGRRRLVEEERQWEKDLLEAGYLRKQVGRSPYYCPGDRVADALSLLLSVGWAIFDSRDKPVVCFADWTCEIQERGASIVLACSSAMREALQAVKVGKSWVDLGNFAGWIDKREALRLFGPLLDGEWESEELRIPKQYLSSCLPLLEQKGVHWAAHLHEAAVHLQAPDGLERAEVGEGFRGKLLSYQQSGVDWLSFIHRFGFGGFLADEMGLGKTVQILAFFSRLRTNLPTLIVAPTSLLYHWQSEFRRFLPESPVTLHAGADRADIAAELYRAREGLTCYGQEKQGSIDPTCEQYSQGEGGKQKDQSSTAAASQNMSSMAACGIERHHFILTSYAILRQDIALFKQMEFETLVFDESNAIKNFGTRTSQAALALTAKARFCMSGTPIENRVEELVAQFEVLMPNLINVNDLQDVMQRKIRPFLMRRLKSDVELELPEKIDQIAWVEMTVGQEKVYEEFKKSALKRLKPMIDQDGASAHRMEILEAILRLRQICCDPRLVGFPDEGSKIEQLLIDLEGLMADGRKVLLYSQFTSMLDLIEESCKTRGWPLLRIDGTTEAKKRSLAVQDFQEMHGSALFLLSLKAGGVGLNLTAADYVLLFDPWWNEAIERQAIDRAHRIGRKGTVFIKRYLTPQSIEEKMLVLKSSKQKIADQLLDLEADGASSWSAEEWLAMLS